MNINSVVWGLRSAYIGHMAYPAFLSGAEIEKLLEHTKTLEVIRGNTVLASEDTNQGVRKSNIAWVGPKEETQWLYKKITDVILMTNATNFNLNLLGLEQLQFTTYLADEQGSYDLHRDTFPRNPTQTCRKLSFTIQLTDPLEYQGGDLVLYTEQDVVTAPKEQGAITFFPSSILHKVTPVTRGIRRSLVGWVVGPDFV